MNRKQLLQLNDYEIDKKIKIQGTTFDRKRKVTPRIVKQMNKMLRKNKSISEIAREFNLSYSAVKYNTDSEWRSYKLASLSGLHTGTTYITAKDRAKYKRDLVKARAISRSMITK